MSCAEISGEKKSFKIMSVNISEEKGVRKHQVDRIELRVGHGIVNDAHAGDWHRQVSLLAEEDIELMRKGGVDLVWGDFAENITTLGIVLHELPIGTVLNIGAIELEVTQIGKSCHSACEIRKLVGDCIMPKRGVFAKVLNGGIITNENIGYYHI
jgi:MOSC domain-containing protein YiiM